MKKSSIGMWKNNLWLLLLIAVVPSLKAQQDWTDGSLDPVEIEIVTERQIKLPTANRNFEKIPPANSELLKPSLTYNFRSLNFQTAMVSPAIRPLKLKQESTSSVYGGYLSVGYGNYASPYLEAFLNSARNKNKLVGAHAWHSSSAKGPVDGKNSGSGTSGLSLYGKTFGKHITLKGDLDFENRFTHFYGYPPSEVVSRDTIRQSFNTISLSGSLSNTRNSDFAYELGADFSYMADKYSARETEVDLNFNSSYKLPEESDIALDARYFFISRKDALVEATPRSLFVIKGSYEFVPKEDVKVSAGLIAAYENDTIDSKDLHLYPDIEATYVISPSVDVVGKLTGGMEKVSLHSLTAENWWLAPNVNIFHTNKTFELMAGVHARLGKKVEIRSGLSFANLKNLYYFVNTPSDPSKFEVVYDRESTKRTNVYASVSYAQTEKAKFLLRTDYYLYSPGSLPEAWHRPTFKATASASLNVYDKILLSTSLIAQAGMKALEPETQQTISLDNAFDLNMRAEYLLSESFSIFLQFHNITSKNYPLYLNYPARGFQALGGITWSF